MTADILNRDMQVIGVVDDFTSFIWTERCRQYGDFEISTRASIERLEVYKKGNYISIQDSDRLMIIDTIQTDTSASDGNTLIVSGKSLEYLLHDRIIWDETVLSGSLQDGIKKLINDNAISPSKSYRKIPKLTFKASTDTRITSLKFKDDEVQYWRENLYDTIEELCNQYHICFRVTYINDDNFQFELFPGVKRTFDQTDNFVIIFSPEYGNLISSKYFDTDEGTCNAGLVVGEKRTLTYEHNDVSTSKDVQYTVELGETISGFDRHEMYIDQTGLSMYIKDIEVPKEKYIARLKNRGETAIRNSRVKPTLEAEVDFNGQFKYTVDYYIGDILEVEDYLGQKMQVRITELVRCHDASGEYVNPAFTPMSEEEDEEEAV